MIKQYNQRGAAELDKLVYVMSKRGSSYFVKSHTDSNGDDKYKP
jgi:hypothetical protein